jgi:hypothetical protein
MLKVSCKAGDSLGENILGSLYHQTLRCGLRHMEPSILMQSGRYTLTRGQVAKRIGKSVSSVRRMEFTTLNPVADERGIFRFDADEVEGLAKQLEGTASPERRAAPSRATKARKDGLLAARTFTMFSRRWSLPRIVAATKQTPERVRTLYHHWVTGLEEGELVADLLRTSRQGNDKG